MKIKLLQWWVPYRNVVAQTPIGKLQGSPLADVVLIAPPVTDAEKEAQLCWCGKSACEFFIRMNTLIGVDVNRFLTIPLTFDGSTPKKDTVALTKQLVASAAAASGVKGFVCVGADAFKHVFGDGHKPSMASLVGHFMHLPAVRNKWVYVFPDPEGLLFDETLSKGRAMAKQRKMEAWFERTIKSFQNYATA